MATSTIYISDTGQYWCTISDLQLFYIYIYLEEEEEEEEEEEVGKWLMILSVQQESCLPN